MDSAPTTTAPSAGGHTRAEDRWALIRLHVENNISLAAIARDSGTALRTLERWQAAYRAKGFEGLKPASPRAERRHRLQPELGQLIEGLALMRPRNSVATIHRKVVELCGKRNWPMPSYSLVWTIVQEIDPGMRVLALEGPVAYRDKYELALRRHADLPNAMWQADHTMLDILIVAPNGKPARPWLSVILDDNSRAACGYMVFLGAPSAMNTALALRQAMWHKSEPDWPMCGIPDVLYVDHGSDFTSDQLVQVAADLHFELVHSTVARPQGRGKIERFFGTVNTELLSVLPGHLTEGQRRPVPQLTLDQLDAELRGLIVSNYNHRTHSETGKTPTDAWISDGWMPRLPDSLDLLDGLLLAVAKTRVVRRDGIHFQGLRYVAPTLAGYVGESVVIRYDPRDISEIRVIHRNQFICKAVDPDHQNATVGLKEIQAARTAQRRQLRRGINERIAVVADFLPAHGTPRIAVVAENEANRPKQRLKIYEEDEV